MKHLETSSANAKVALAVISVLLMATAAIATQPGTWKAREDLAAQRAFAATAEVDGIIYAIGGSPGLTVADTVFAYAPAVDHWFEMSAMPAPRTMAAAAVVDGKIYVIGGALDLDFTATGAVEVYDPALESWNTRRQHADAPQNPKGLAIDVDLNSMPIALWGSAAVAMDGLIYVFGGGNGDAMGNHSCYSTVFVYNPVADSWDTAPDMPTARCNLSASVVDGMIYVAGGSSEDQVSSAFEVYDPSSDNWVVAADLPTARESLATASVGGKVYAFGGLSWKREDAIRFADERHQSFEDMKTLGLNRVDSPREQTFEDDSTRSEPARVDTPREQTHEDDSTTSVPVWVDNPRDQLFEDDVGTWGLARVVHEVDVYDPQTKTWEQPTRMPDQRWGLGAAVVDGTVHLIGGGANATFSGSNHVDTYDPDRFTFWTEVVAHLEGAQGSQWRTDLCAHNGNIDQANLEMVLHTRFNEYSHLDEIGPQKQKVFPDIVEHIGVEGKGLFEVWSDQPLLLAGRIYSEDDIGTVGQFCQFQTMEDGFAAGDTGLMVGLRQKEGLFRTNLTLANTGIRQALVVIDLFDCAGKKLCGFHRAVQPATLDQVIEPLANKCGEPNIGWAFAKVRVAVGAGVRISASVIDSRTNDGTTIVAQR
ncbi:MAG: hypothetical protein DRJ65_20135 [Acidobacteria bacterium]|nr:MAG: hypothetical protein DRJ65_20135 [Acidobacteriota bacterium]